MFLKEGRQAEKKSLKMAKQQLKFQVRDKGIMGQKKKHLLQILFWLNNFFFKL